MAKVLLSALVFVAAATAAPAAAGASQWWH